MIRKVAGGGVGGNQPNQVSHREGVFSIHLQAADACLLRDDCFVCDLTFHVVGQNLESIVCSNH